MEWFQKNWLKFDLTYFELQPNLVSRIQLVFCLEFFFFFYYELRILHTNMPTIYQIISYLKSQLWYV